MELPFHKNERRRKRTRPKSHSLDDIVLENSQEFLQVRQGNRTSSISIKEALVKGQTAMALNGNRLAVQASLDRIDKAEQNQLAKALYLYETVLDYKDSYPARAKDCRNRGLPPPLPHPDDVRFDRCTGGITFIGPRDHEELATLKKILEARKIFMTMLEEHRSDVEECARQGCPYSPSDLEIISSVEKHLRSFEDEFDRRDWLPRVAGGQA